MYIFKWGIRGAIPARSKHLVLTSSVFDLHGHTQGTLSYEPRFFPIGDLDQLLSDSLLTDLDYGP